MSDNLLDIHCNACDYTETWNKADALAALHAAGMLKRDLNPAWELMLELLPAALAAKPCPDCGEGLTAEPTELSDEDWGMGKKCKACSKTIPAERVELFPDIELCAACQNRDDAGELPEAVEYCPRCGAVMTMQQKRRGGLSRYEMVCTGGCR